MLPNLKNTTTDDALILYSECSPAQVRAAQRRLKAGALGRIAAGVLSALPASEWPALVALHRTRLLSALFPGAVVGYRSAMMGGLPVVDVAGGEVMYLSYSYSRTVQLPGLKVVLIAGAAQLQGDLPMAGRDFYFPSTARVLLENLTMSRGANQRSAGRDAVEARLVSIYDARGEAALNQLRDEVRQLTQTLKDFGNDWYDFDRERRLLNDLIGSLLGTRHAALTTPSGKAWAAGMPFDATRLALFERLAASLRHTPFTAIATPAQTMQERMHFAFLESYFSNFIEGTEFDVQEARQIVLQGRVVANRPKDSHDITGVFAQSMDAGWANQTLASGDALLQQLQARHGEQMKARPEVQPGQFKDRENFAGNTAFVLPRHVRGTLLEAGKLLPTVPQGFARALLAMFVVSEVHPFNDGNGRLARLVMNAELQVVGACKIIVPTLFRDEYLDCLRVLTREGEPEPFLRAMQKMQAWTAAFQYDDLDAVIAHMQACHAFEKSRTQFRLLMPVGEPQTANASAISITGITSTASENA